MLYLGDCVEKIKNIESGSVDLTVTSPPYDDIRTYGSRESDWNDQNWKSIIGELYRVTKTGGVVVWIVNDATINGGETGTSFRQALHAIDVGFLLHDTMIWNKGGFSAVGALKTRYGPVFDYMFVWSKGRPKTFNRIEDRVNKHPTDVRKSNAHRKADGTTYRTVSTQGREFGARFNIWEIGPQRQRGEGNHPAPFPEAIARDHIISWSKEGDLILDPFLGSGTTGKVAIENNRRFIGIEKNQEYFAMAEKRIAEAVPLKVAAE